MLLYSAVPQGHPLNQLLVFQSYKLYESHHQSACRLV
uniref:Uncharacterized protein n=1 Tax=Rhizophora mucronata TaxID=61149 RepID=A0A2P2JS47_RHIMU